MKREYDYVPDRGISMCEGKVGERERVSERASERERMRARAREQASEQEQVRARAHVTFKK